jgi:uncharacterized protein (DUF1330 family)
MNRSPQAPRFAGVAPALLVVFYEGGLAPNREDAMKTLSHTTLVVLAGFAIGAGAVQALHAAGNAPVYVITEVGISDLEAYQKEYLPLAQAAIKAAGGRLLAAGQNIVVFEGPSPGTRVAINQFDSLDAAQAWRNSDRFKEARKVGDKYAKFRSFAIEGLAQ